MENRLHFNSHFSWLRVSSINNWEIVYLKKGDPTGEKWFLKLLDGRIVLF